MIGMPSKLSSDPVPRVRSGRIVRTVQVGLLLVCGAAVSLPAAKVRVVPGSGAGAIAAAVARAQAGDTIIVGEGTYRESDVEIDKPLTLVGEGRPVIDGDGLSIFHIRSDDVAISGFKLINVQASYTKELAAIHVHRSERFAIRDNVLDDVFFGILVEKSKQGSVAHNTIRGYASDEYNSGNGIHLWHSSGVEVSDNHVVGMRDGIYFEFVSDSRVSDNISHGNIRYGLHFMFSNDDAYTGNSFRHNGAGVAIMFSKNIEMHHNEFVENWGTASYGLLLKEINDANITHNLFAQNTIAVKTEGSNRINYASNTFRRNGWAVKVTGACYENDFRFNNFLSNAFDVSYQGSVNDNVFAHNHWSEYAGYDLDRDGVGDVPYRPVKLFSYVVNRTPETIVLLRSLFVDIINFSEKVSPIFTPDELVDAHPRMRKFDD
jgi:nitrous oxidase accessory protein